MSNVAKPRATVLLHGLRRVGRDSAGSGSTYGRSQNLHTEIRRVAYRLRHEGQGQGRSAVPTTSRGSVGQDFVNPQSQDILVDDLWATLDAHRARNQSHDDPAFEEGEGEEDKDQETYSHSRLIRTQQKRWRGFANAPKSAEHAIAILNHRINSGDSQSFFEAARSSEKRGSATKGGFGSEDHVSRLKNNFVSPWLQLINQSTDDTKENLLSTEIDAFERYMRLSPAERGAYRHVFTELSTRLRDMFALKLVGSLDTDTAASTSDMDVYITKDKQQPTSPGPLRTRHATDSLRRCRKALRKYDRFSPTFIRYARICLVTLRHGLANIEIQIQDSVNQEMQREMVKNYLHELPSLRPLYFVLREFLAGQGLKGADMHGISSYPLLMMIVTTIKWPDGSAKRSLGDELLFFFEFWGNANIESLRYTVDPPQMLPKTSNYNAISRAKEDDPGASIDLGQESDQNHSDTRSSSFLSLQDPADEDNDLGRHIHKICRILDIFRFTHQQMSAAIAKEKLDFYGNIKPTAKSLLTLIFKRDFFLTEVQRSVLDRFARGKVRKDRDYRPERIWRDCQDRMSESGGRNGKGSQAGDIIWQQRLLDQFRSWPKLGESERAKEEAGAAEVHNTATHRSVM